MPSFDRDTRGRKSRLSPAFLLVFALCLLFAASASAAAPNWLDPADLSTPGRDASNPVVEMDGAGNTIALWERQSVADPSFNTQISTRAVGGSFSAPVELALHGTEPQLAIAAGGEAVAAWKRRQGLFYVIEAAVRPPGAPSPPRSRSTPCRRKASSRRMSARRSGAVATSRSPGAASTSKTERTSKN